MIDQLLQYDTELFLYLNNLGTPTWDGFWMFYTTKFNWIPFYAVLLYLIYKKRADKRIIISIVVIVLMVTFTDQITNMFKRGFERPRPCYEMDLVGLMRLVKSNCGGAFGYFSGHASNSMAAALFVGLTLRYKYKYFIYFMIFWAMLMGYSRIYVGVHYPLDVLSGMVFGVFMGILFYKLDGYLQNKFGSRFKPSV